MPDFTPSDVLFNAIKSAVERFPGLGKPRRRDLNDRIEEAVIDAIGGTAVYIKQQVPRRSLPRELVDEIERRLSGGQTCGSIATDLRVSRSTVWRIQSALANPGKTSPVEAEQISQADRAIIHTRGAPAVKASPAAVGCLAPEQLPERILAFLEKHADAALVDITAQKQGHRTRRALPIRSDSGMGYRWDDACGRRFYGVDPEAFRATFCLANHPQKVVEALNAAGMLVRGGERDRWTKRVRVPDRNDLRSLYVVSRPAARANKAGGPWAAVFAAESTMAAVRPLGATT